MKFPKALRFSNDVEDHVPGPGAYLGHESYPGPDALSFDRLQSGHHYYGGERRCSTPTGSRMPSMRRGPKSKGSFIDSRKSHSRSHIISIPSSAISRPTPLKLNKTVDVQLLSSAPKTAFRSVALNTDRKEKRNEAKCMVKNFEEEMDGLQRLRKECKIEEEMDGLQRLRKECKIHQEEQNAERTQKTNSNLPQGEDLILTREKTISPESQTILREDAAIFSSESVESSKECKIEEEMDGLQRLRKECKIEEEMDGLQRLRKECTIHQEEQNAKRTQKTNSNLPQGEDLNFTREKTISPESQTILREDGAIFSSESVESSTSSSQGFSFPSTTLLPPPPLPSVSRRQGGLLGLFFGKGAGCCACSAY